RLNQIIQHLAAHGPPPAPAPSAPGAAPDLAAPAPPAATDDDPSDWIESLSAYADGLEESSDARALATEVGAVGTSAKPRVKHPLPSRATIYVAAVLVLLAVGSLIYVIANAAMHDDGASASVASALAPAASPNTPPVSPPPTPPVAPQTRVVDLI